ncbi:MAG: hypothetical protein Q9181_001435 [Wetmoreana brouardii]
MATSMAPSNPQATSNEDRSLHIIAAAQNFSKRYQGLYSFIAIAVDHGFGKHINAIPKGALFDWFKYLYAFEFLYALAMASVKYSV